jgi:hypothetical protein
MSREGDSQSVDGVSRSRRALLEDLLIVEDWTQSSAHRTTRLPWLMCSVQRRNSDSFIEHRQIRFCETKEASLDFVCRAITTWPRSHQATPPAKALLRILPYFGDWPVARAHHLRLRGTEQMILKGFFPPPARM